MAAKVKPQLVELKPGFAGDHRSRPLKSGKKFTLVVALPRVTRLVWNRDCHDPGDPCQLTLHGRHLGKNPIDVVIEVENEHGAWSTAATVQAHVEGSETKAVAEWKFPEPPGHAAAVAARAEATKGRLVRAELDKTELTAGDTVSVQVEGHQLEGAPLVVFVEREEPDGSWRYYAHMEGTLEAGLCKVAWQVPGSDERKSKSAEGRAAAVSLLECRFEDGAELTEGQTAWLVAKLGGLDGSLVEIILEREQAENQWVPAGQAVSTVKVGEARAGIPLGPR